MTLYCYADETVFDKEKEGDEEYIGSGMFVSDEKITGEFIDEALSDLNGRDPEKRTPSDEVTLSRGYFHASEDGPEAHSSICKAIDRNLYGNFYYTFCERSNVDRRNQFGGFKILRWTLMTCFLHLLHSQETVELFIEKRQKFDKENILNWKSDMYDLLEKSVVEMPGMPKTFPRLNIHSAEKDNPGVQVTDFILWAVNRSHGYQDNNTWIEYLGIPKTVDRNIERGVYEGTYEVNDGLLLPPLQYPQTVEIKEPKSDQEIVDITRFIVEIADLIYEKHKQTDIGQKFYPDLFEEYEEYDQSKGITEESLNLACSLYLRTIDTFPFFDLYNRNPIGETLDLSCQEKNRWEVLLKAKMTACNLLGRRECDHSQLISKLNKESYQISGNRPYFLGNVNEFIKL